MSEETYQYDLVRGFLDGLLPEERLLVSEWADKHRYLAQGASPEPGLWKTSRVPYLKGIMDALSTHISYRRIIFKKAAQIGASEMGFNWIGYKIDNSPGALLIVMPTEGQAKRNSKMRIDPMIRATPRLAAKIQLSKGKDASNTILQKDFPGGTLIISGANSPSGLRSMPVEGIMLDEVDGYPLDLSGEGSPVNLAEARTRNYKRRKIFIPSTPTVEGVSVVDAEYQKTDKQKFHVPCPHCGAIQHLQWENIKYDGKDVTTSPDTAYYECEHCHDAIYERHKRDMLAAGQWIATDPSKSRPDTIGFHLNSLYSPWYTFADLVKEYLNAGTDMNKLNAFTNLSLGECSKPMTDAPGWEALYDKAKLEENVHSNKPNRHVKIITAGVDVQKNRLELTIIGWGFDKRRWVLDYRILTGDVFEKAVWDELEKVTHEFWINPDEVEIPLGKMCVDSGAYTSEVYKFCKRFSNKKVVPTKGMDNMTRIVGNPIPINTTTVGKTLGTAGNQGVMLYPVGSSYMKTELYGYLLLHKMDEDELGPAGYIHLIKYGEEYFRGLVAEEERVKQDKKGFNKSEWVKIYERNEPLDTMNYARAAASLMGIDRFDNNWLDRQFGTNVKRTPEPPKPLSEITLSNKTGGFWD